MAINLPKRQALETQGLVMQWLFDSDPSIRWQVMQDLICASAEDVAAERARVAAEGAGAKLLALQGTDGRWSSAAWSRGWNSTMHVLMLLRDMGLDPASDQACRAVNLVRDRVTWEGCGPQECDRNSFFEGELEPCINAQVGAVGAYFGQDVRGIIDRLLAEQLPDGGWNCEAANGSTRSSFNTTICVLEALLIRTRPVFVLNPMRCPTSGKLRRSTRRLRISRKCQGILSRCWWEGCFQQESNGGPSQPFVRVARLSPAENANRHRGPPERGICGRIDVRPVAQKSC